jgi:hypothetical protein
MQYDGFGDGDNVLLHYSSLLYYFCFDFNDELVLFGSSCALVRVTTRVSSQWSPGKMKIAL